MRILVAEDDAALQDVICFGLRDSGYQVDAVARGDDAIDQLKWYDYDVAIVDWRMPGAEGIDVVAWARKHDKPTALLMLTARDAPQDRIRGLDTGADDYLVKPFDFGELLARVRALQRRPRGVAAPILEKGRVSLDPARRTVSAEGRELSLTATEYLILELLMRRSPGGRGSQADRRARLGGRDGSAGQQRHRRPAEPAARQAAQRRHPHRHRARRRLPAGGSVTAGAMRMTDVRRQSLRVALAATGIVALAYLVVAIAVVFLVTKNLTDQVDHRLTDAIAHIQRDAGPRRRPGADSSSAGRADPGSRRSCGPCS